MAGLAVDEAVNLVVVGPDQLIGRPSGASSLYLPNPFLFHCLTAFPTLYSHNRVPSFQKKEKKFSPRGLCRLGGRGRDGKSAPDRNCFLSGALDFVQTASAHGAQFGGGVSQQKRGLDTRMPFGSRRSLHRPHYSSTGSGAKKDRLRRRRSSGFDRSRLVSCWMRSRR